VKDIVERLLTENTMHSYYDSPAIQLDAAREITRLRAGLQRIVEGDGFWDAPSMARDLLAGKDVT
jgi:hypothetical protein